MHPLKVVKVPFAAKWTERLREGVEGTDAPAVATGQASATAKGDSSTPVAAQQLSADWTFSSDYVCTLVSCETATDTDAGAGVGADRLSRGVVVRARELPSASRSWDRALGGGFSTINLLGAEDEVRNRALGADGGDESVEVPDSPWRIEVAAESGVDYTMLRRQDEPILFYDECILYQVKG